MSQQSPPAAIWQKTSPVVPLSQKPSPVAPLSQKTVPVAPLSQWLQLMLAEIASKREELERANAETARRVAENDRAVGARADGGRDTDLTLT